MHHHHQPHRNRLPQPNTSPHDNQPPTPQAILEPTAFASQLDEIDRLLRAFRLQRQRQSAYQWMGPADEDTDEKLLDSESDGESGRRWSSSTESKDAGGGGGGGGGGGAVSDVVSVVDGGILARRDGADSLGRTPVRRVTDQALGFGSVLPASKARLANLAYAPEGEGLWTERRSVGRAVGWERRPDGGTITQPHTSNGFDSSSVHTVTEGDPTELKIVDVSPFPPGLEVTCEKTELAPVRKVTFGLPSINEDDDEGN